MALLTLSRSTFTITSCVRLKTLPLLKRSSNVFNTSQNGHMFNINIPRCFQCFARSNTKFSTLLSLTSRSRATKNLIKEVRLPFRQKRSYNSERLDKPLGPSTLIKPLLFTVGVTSTAFFAAFLYSYEKWRAIFKQLHKGKYKHENVNGKIDFKDLWHSTNSGQKLIMGIIAANLCVFGLWQTNTARLLLERYFVSWIGNPVSSMLGSCFSHSDKLHVGVNMYVLWSFGPLLANALGVEQFSAVYLSAGVISAFASMAACIVLRRPMTSSVGASGCLMALIGIMGVTNPNAQFSIAFVDMIVPHSFSAEKGIMGIIAIDVVGLLLGWRVLDHAGHLGGIIFGILYAKYGQKPIWGTARKAVLEKYKNIRDKKM